MSYCTSVRDQCLDFLEGAAIVLVVLGHHLQGVYPAFDDSFHMPLFMFVGGWAASISFRDRFGSVQADAATELTRSAEVILKMARRLLLPFCSWGAVMYFTRPNYALVPAMDYMVLLFRYADNGLWFLPALFFLSCLHSTC
ncbi:MAG: acyltransferase family protein, partial [Chlorobium sp.]|nr:acyltransferase family protein [Chlorobium sp.]